jgi:ABC-2 type transport system ATP-binding protein
VKQVRLTFTGAPPRLPDIPGVLQVFRAGQELRVVCAHYDASLEQALNALSPLNLEICPVSLEDALISYLGERGEKTFILTETETKS